MIISINPEKSLDRILHPFMMKIPNKLGTEEGNILNLVKVIYKNPIANIIVEKKKMDLFTLRIMARMSAPIALIHYTGDSN